MLVIRLARAGRSKYPTYRLVAAESARAATGKFVAVLGHYNPHTKELVIKREEIQKHLANGAQPSNTVVKLLTREKVDLPGWVKLKVKAPKPVAATQAEESAPKAEATSVADASADLTPEEPAIAAAAETADEATAETK
ncbi:MAG TPA: 30S ribosomal protein S16 [Candidatus Saccharimonadia bacterium]|nr:30S ribosomal protein S16 [Candidatus Saccharimonadia bacterium]